MAAVALATCMWIIDEHRVTGWTKPFVIYGMNPIVAFVGSGVMARLIYSIFKVESNGQPIALQAWIYQTFYASWLAPRNASLLFAITFVLVWFGDSLGAVPPAYFRQAVAAWRGWCATSRRRAHRCARLPYAPISRCRARNACCHV